MSCPTPSGDLAGRESPGFFIATGFSGHGFGIGPGAGKLVADMFAVIRRWWTHPVPPDAVYRQLKPATTSLAS
jgi:glycine/D-amino acid oxidase-like deaminating enzyme